MSSREEVTLPATRPKSRKSLGHTSSAQSMDQENMTADVGTMVVGKRAPIEKTNRKSRSKSIGPGGLDALKDTTGNRRKSLAVIPQPPPKSILKPTMPPLREIPAHISTRRGSPKKVTPPSAHKTQNLIDFDVEPVPGPTVTGVESLANPFEVEKSATVNETRVTLRTEEEQQAAAREREDKERAELEKEIISRRDARRKSLANRRVSFAPEATLHTWDVVVEYQDSTISSNATNSTRRGSSITGGSVGSPHLNGSAPASSDPSEPPSTPPEQIEEDTVNASPAHQRDLHQKKRRRSSGIPPMNFNNPDDDDALSSSPFSGDSDMDIDDVVDDDGSNSNSDSADDDGTMMSLDGGDTTSMSMASVSDASTGTNTRLEQALRQAARQSETHGIDFDDEDEEVVASFAPQVKKTPMQKLESQQDQENLNPFSASFSRGPPVEEDAQSDGDEMTMEMTRAVGGIMSSKAIEQESDEDEMSMDVTRAFGGIISNPSQKPTISRRKSMPSNRRQSSRRRSSGETSSFGDETMDLTQAIGNIKSRSNQTFQPEDEDVTMDFTSIIEGVLPQLAGRPSSLAIMQNPSGQKIQQSTETMEDATMDMDMTVAMGGIRSLPEVSTPNEDATIEMEMTTALGGILPPQNRLEAKKIMEIETDLGSSPFRADPVPESPPKFSAPTHTVASETGSPSFAGFRGKVLRRSVEARQPPTPNSKLSTGGTPVKKPATPSKQLTPKPARPTTPGKTPPSKNVVMRTSSPKRLFKEEIKAGHSTPPSATTKNSAAPYKLFQKDKNTGAATPNFILTPQPRRNSGIGLDKVGLGSPRVAALLDRRQSIGEQAKSFTPIQFNQSQNAICFLNPRIMEEEIDREREKAEDRENGRSILEREADQGGEEKDATLNLKDMIQSMTPKKRPLRGRKSLHVGAAKGILGKRPVELDEDGDDEEDNGGVKRLKNHQGSPVKSVKLPGPPSKAETTTGRLTRAARKSIDETITSTLTPSISSPVKAKSTTPRHQGRYKDVEALAKSQDIAPPAEKEPVDDPMVDEESFGDDRIQLQDFLNMTSIRFMELTTTKRRHTIAPKAVAKGSNDVDKPIALEDCVAAGAATVPMLELFQHACHELKKYISEGRKTVREIETETFEENPPLFREYISATPDMKNLMDNQLKNVKTHARLLSKGMWYDWRMTLLGTLKEGLFKTAEGMIQDEEILDQQQALLETVLPGLIRQAETLQREEADLQFAAEEIASCDQEELSGARQRLIIVDADIEAKKQLVADLKKKLERKEAEIDAGNQKKQIWLDEIREAEKIREECRGWTSIEITALKAKVDALEKEHGWTITGVSGTSTSMTYRKEIEIEFDAACFASKSSNHAPKLDPDARIDLWYFGDKRAHNPIPKTDEMEFFLSCTRDHVRGFNKAETTIKDLLNAVSASWNKARTVVDQIRLLNVSCLTEVIKTSDSSIMIKSLLLISPLTTKVEILFHLISTSGDYGIEVQIEPSAKVIYGEKFNEPKMGEFLAARCGVVVEERDSSSKVPWGDAVTELGEKLLARGRKP